MTNEEIRNKEDKEWFDDAKIDAPYLIEMIESIQQATRADERTRLIKEIEGLARKCFPYIGLSDEHGFHLIKFLEQINSLKQ